MEDSGLTLVECPHRRRPRKVATVRIEGARIVSVGLPPQPGRPSHRFARRPGAARAHQRGTIICSSMAFPAPESIASATRM